MRSAVRLLLLLLLILPIGLISRSFSGVPPAPNPPLAPAPADNTVTPESTGSATPVRLNLAGRAELMSLPGIGPALAGRILDYRRLHGRFRRAEELLKIRGISPRKWAELRSLVRP